MTVLDQTLERLDPEVHSVVGSELARQQGGLAMTASENFTPLAVMQAQGSVLTNTFPEGCPGRHHRGGCEQTYVIERLARERVKSLFGASHANVQPHSGAQANAAVLSTLLDPGDTILGFDPSHGGQLTHGLRVNHAGSLYRVRSYQVSEVDGLVDMDDVERLAIEYAPRVITAAWSAYPRRLDFARFRRIADSVGAGLVVDMGSFAGLVAAGLHPNPVPHAHVTTTTTHQTLGGPRGGAILTNDPELATRLDRAVCPGQLGGPLEHNIAAKAVGFGIAASPEFRERQERTLAGASIIAERLCRPDVAARGVSVLSGGTDVHLVLVDLRGSSLDGRQVEQRLVDLGITVDRFAVPFDHRPPAAMSGLRIGTSALASRGFGQSAFTEVADVLAMALSEPYDLSIERRLTARVDLLANAHPLYPGL